MRHSSHWLFISISIIPGILLKCTSVIYNDDLSIKVLNCWFAHFILKSLHWWLLLSRKTQTAGVSTQRWFPSACCQNNVQIIGGFQSTPPILLYWALICHDSHHCCRTHSLLELVRVCASTQTTTLGSCTASTRSISARGSLRMQLNEEQHKASIIVNSDVGP